MTAARIVERCSCGASIDAQAGQYRNDKHPANPRGAEEIVERWRKDHACTAPSEENA